MNDLDVREELDFAYLLELMPPLHDTPEFAWLPELFSIVGYKSLIDLCRFCGGEYIKVPTLEQLKESIEVLQLFYEIEITGKKTKGSIPENLIDKYEKVVEVYSREC